MQQAMTLATNILGAVTFTDATTRGKRPISRMPGETYAAPRSQGVSGADDVPESFHTSTTNNITSTELAAAERENAIESLREPVAHSAVTADQWATLERLVAADPTFADALIGAVEQTKKQERKQAFVDWIATMIVTRNIRPEQLQVVHFNRTTLPEFKRLLDEAIAAKENDPAVLGEREQVMNWRLEVERQKHEYVWAVWQAENEERARREAAIRANGLE